MQALHKLGEFNNHAIRSNYLPRRLSFDVAHYWQDRALRLQQIIFAKYNTDDGTRGSYFGLDNPAFGSYFKQQSFNKDDAEEIIMKLQQMMIAMDKKGEEVSNKVAKMYIAMTLNGDSA